MGDRTIQKSNNIRGLYEKKTKKKIQKQRSYMKREDINRKETYTKKKLLII